MQRAIAISGIGATGEEVMEQTALLGRLVAERGFVLLTGTATGVPFWAARAAKEAGGTVIGFSPASNRREHEEHGFPTDYHDVIIYTGFRGAGRNLLLARAADALVTVCGDLSSLGTVAAAAEEDVVQGFLAGSGGIADALPQLLEASKGWMVFESDPAVLMEKIIERIEKRDEKHHLAHAR